MTTESPFEPPAAQGEADMSTAVAEAAPPQALAGPISVDLPCVSCQYNLRALSPGGACPECGTHLARSLDPNLLCFVDPKHIGSLAAGIDLLLMALLAGAVAVGMRGILGMASEVALETGFGLGVVLLLAASLLTLAGAWLVTTPDRGRWDAHALNARRAARAAAFLGPWYALLPVLAKPRGLDISASTSAALVLPWLVLQLASVVALSVYLRSLALRVPHRRLAQGVRGITWVMIVAIALSIVEWLASMGVLRAGLDRYASYARRDVYMYYDSPAHELFFITSLIRGLAYLIGGLWWLAVLVRFRRGLGVQAKLARSIRDGLSGRNDTSAG